MNYSRPRIVVDMDLAEGVYAASGAAASGGACMSATATLGERDGEGLYRIQISGTHDGAGHTNNAQEVTLTFNQPVEVKRSSAAKKIVDSGVMITLKYAFWYDQNQSHKLEEHLYVASEPGLALLSVSATDDGYTSEVTW